MHVTIGGYTGHRDVLLVQWVGVLAEQRYQNREQGEGGWWDGHRFHPSFYHLINILISTSNLYVPSSVVTVQQSVYRPADILVPNWYCGRPAAFDLTVISPLNTNVIAEAGFTGGVSCICRSQETLRK